MYYRMHQKISLSLSLSLSEGAQLHCGELQQPCAVLQQGQERHLCLG